MAMEELTEELTKAFDEYRTAIAKAYACTCDWSQYCDQHADSCPREIRLRDIEGATP